MSSLPFSFRALASTPRGRREDGFTLVEILVVIIIIGILAAIAIPIFINQQRTARDSATTQDLKNLVTNIETGRVSGPDAATYLIYTTPTGHETASGELGADLEVVYLQVGNNPKRLEVPKTKGTRFIIGGSPHRGVGAYVVYAWNPDGREYRDYVNNYSKPGTSLAYDSLTGGVRDL